MSVGEIPIARGIAIAAVIVAGLWAPGAVATGAASDATLIGRGNQQWAAGRVEDARKSFEQAVAANPRSVEAHMKLAGLQLSSGDNSAAIQTYQRVIGLDGKHAKAWIGLGMAYLHSGQRELSRAALGEAVRADPALKAQFAELLETPAE
jgi:Tfp pilus assembly protein PilF